MPGNYGQFSPDGRWWWNGTQWVPAPPQSRPHVPIEQPDWRTDNGAYQESLPARFRSADVQTTSQGRAQRVVGYSVLALAVAAVVFALVAVFSGGGDQPLGQAASPIPSRVMESPRATPTPMAPSATPEPIDPTVVSETPTAQAAAGTVRLKAATAVDGDTIRIRRGDVRVLGYDTPEMGQCGYYKAARVADRLVAGGITLHGFAGRDRYGRILAHVRLADGRDLGTIMIRKGLGVARYDSRDGYDWHKYEARYHRIDGRTPNICGFDPTRPAQPATPKAAEANPGSGSVYYENCDAARAAGAAPVYRGDPGYGSHLDRDGDGRACEE